MANTVPEIYMEARWQCAESLNFENASAYVVVCDFL